MSTTAISAISATTLEEALTAIENAALTSASTSTTSANGPTAAQQLDSSVFSPLSQLISALQQLQETDPAKHSQVTQQIATNLQTAAQAAQTQGNSTEANQLTALASDFSSASKSGQPSTLIEDLTSAPARGHHHHSSGAPLASSSALESPPTSDDKSNQLLSLIQTNESQSTQSTNLNAAATILNTLTAAGITASSFGNAAERYLRREPDESVGAIPE